uniref:Uncharacterized protein n=1 Tax=Setaria digitata TaxID=48799 RepID=A0A915PVX8_9BILA
MQGIPPRCDVSLLLEYLNDKEYEYYLALGYADSCVSVMTKIASGFGTNDMVAAVKSLSDLHYHNQSHAAMHEPSVMKSLQAQDIQCSFNNMHPVLISLDLNVTIIVDFDNRTNRKIYLSFDHFFFPRQMDPSGTYIYYTVFEKDKQQSIYRMKVDYPNFTFVPQKPLQTVEKLFNLNGNDQIFPIDRSALLVWKLAGKKRSAWVYEGSCAENSKSKNSFHQIGCILSGINDPDGRLLMKIHQVRRQL